MGERAVSGWLMFVLVVIVGTSVGVTVTVLARAAGVPQFIIEPLRFFVAVLVCYGIAVGVWPVRMRPAWRWMVSFAVASTLLLLFNYLTMVR
jgi:hypothetical protein